LTARLYTMRRKRRLQKVQRLSGFFYAPVYSIAAREASLLLNFRAV
jgi:hypothetical protein